MKILMSILSILFVGLSAQAEVAKNDGLSIMKDINEGRILLGRVMLSESDKSATDTDNDTFAMPACGSGNKFIHSIRLRAPKKKNNGAKNRDALIKKVTIVYGNGNAETLKVNKVLNVTNNSGDGLTIDLKGSMRCVRAISVLGEQYDASSNHSNSQVNVVGLK